MKYTTEYDKQIEKQSKTFEERLVESIINNYDLTALMEEANEIYRVGYFTKREYKDLTNIDLYKEMLS